jgi:hypothetical protein
MCPFSIASGLSIVKVLLVAMYFLYFGCKDTTFLKILAAYYFAFLVMNSMMMPKVGCNRPEAFANNLVW